MDYLVTFEFFNSISTEFSYTQNELKYEPKMAASLGERDNLDISGVHSATDTRTQVQVQVFVQVYRCILWLTDSREGTR